MYRGRGAGRWAESSSSARVLPYKPPAYACTAARRDVPEGTRSLLCSPYRAAAVWTAVAKALKAHSPRGQRGPPSRRRSRCRGGGGGGCAEHVRYGPGGLWRWPSAVAACDPRVGIGATARRGCSGPPKMRQKTSGSATRGSAAGGSGCSAGQGAREAGESRRR